MDRHRLRRIAREALPIAALALAILAARSSLADHYVVPSGSMEYTLLPGDHVLVDKTAYGLRLPFLGWRITGGERPARGEVVVFDSPDDGTRLIKRVAAVGGDRVELRDGRLFVNGRALSRPGTPVLEVHGGRVARLNLRLGGGPDIGPFVVEEGRLLLLGDFRGNSRDGRVFGLVPEEAIYARARAVFLRRGIGPLWQPL